MYAWIVSLILLLFAPQTVVPASYDSLKQRAEAGYAEKSFAEAHELYEQAALLELSGEERRWVDFRVADTKWRSDRSADASALQKLIENSGDNHDRVWAEAHESLGDFTTSRNDYSNANNSNYLQALDWWSGSDDIPLARSRYLALVFKMIGAPQYEGAQENYNGAPREVLVNALKIATSSEDLARLRFILASQLLAERRPESIERALELLDSILRDQKSSAWYDDALFAEANQLASVGDVVMVDGEPRIKPDYERALALYRRIVSELPRGTTRYYDQAQHAINEITTPQLTLNTTGNFLPDSEQEVMLFWRNAGPIECSINRIDLTSDLQMKGFKGDLASIVEAGSGQAIRKWTIQPKDNGLYFPGSDRVRISPRLDAGAYLVSVRTAGASGKTVLLVSDINIVTHSLGLSDEIYVSDVHRGAPIAGARIHVSDQTHEAVATTDANGLAHVDLHASNDYRQLLITAAAGNRQAWMSTYNYAYWIGSEGGAQWRVYAFTDRPAYRPDETVQWKALVRVRNNDGPWVTPSKQSLDYVITDPRGQKVATGTTSLNEYGSYWADLKLTPQMALGPYTIGFLGRNGESRGSAQLFTLEEYKLPEYTVNVSIPNQYRLGDTVEAVVDAQYYFGGPVANATVLVSVDRSSYSPWWGVIDWYTPRDSRGYYPGGGNQNVFKQTLKTDENGRALVHFDTQVDAGDSSYTINACATDASRREVCGAGSVNVMRQRYTVHAQTQHSIGTPGQKISVDFKAADSKEQPVKTAGKVHVTRRKWERCKNELPYCGQYREEDVLTSNVTTNDEGIGTFTFTPEREGYYQLEWSSEDRTPGKPLRARDIVKTQTSLWITRNTSTEIGYHAGGLELIVDRDTLRSGDRVPLIIATENSDRWVMLTISGASILDTRLVHLDGTLKVVEVPIDQRHVPDFMVTASSVFNRAFYTQTKSLKVPPFDRALTVEVTSDHDDYMPHGKGSVTITTRDYEGRPVTAEVALSVSDESVTAIAQDPAGDPRQFFYGESRVRQLTVNAGVQMQRFVRLVEGKDGTLVDENAARRERELDDLKKDEGRVSRDGYAINGAAIPPQAVAEAITVTGAAAVLAPPPPPAPAALKSRANTGEERQQQIEVVVRNDFRSTAFWKPDIVTNANGIATATFEYPEALTEWRATARVATVDSRFGMASSKTHTKLPLIVRLEGPRFFVAGDRAVVSAVMNNNTDKPMTVTPSLEATGITVTSEAAKSVDVPPHGEARAEWTIAADQQGTAKLRVTGRSASEADAMEKSFTVYEHGIDKLVARSGKVRGSEAIIQLPLPGARRDTSLIVNVSPSLASAMLDALPYLIDYPYGCTEQTMSRFLPASIVARAAAKQNLPRPAWLGKLNDVTDQSVRRLYDFQHGDGGWGWWKDDSSQTFMTAYVIWGFAVAREGEVAVDQNRLDRAVQWLDEQLVKSENDANGEAWMLHALAAWRRVSHQKITGLETKAFDRAFAQREQLSAYARALLALAAHDFGDTSRAQILIRNLENGVKMDRSPDRSVLVGNAGAPSAPETMATAHWGADRFWWHWYEGPVESTAFSLQALVEIDPDNKLVEPVMNWLVKNRRGARWNNTRDSAIALLALTDYLRASGELSGDNAYELSVNGKVIARKSEGGHFTIDRGLVRDANEITIRRTSGKSPLYFSVEGRFVSLEEPVTAAGHELFVKREYLRLVPKPTLLKGVVYDKVPMADGATIASGDRVEVVVTIETKNDYDYLLFEDLKPAGFEATSVNSGGISATNKENNYAWIYQELRDRKVAMFASHLDQGIWTIRYQLRAETPGSFHALPLMGEAMYVPEVRANGEETHVVVK